MECYNAIAEMQIEPLPVTESTKHTYTQTRFHFLANSRSNQMVRAICHIKTPEVLHTSLH